MTEFVRRVDIGAAWDKRDPDPKKNYGVHGADLRMTLIGPLGAVSFVVYTMWHTPAVQTEMRTNFFKQGPDEISLKALFEPMPADVGWHWRTPLWADDEYGLECKSQDCDFLDGAPCFYDGSGLQAEEVFAILVTQGSDAVWEQLEERYVYMVERTAVSPEDFALARVDTEQLRDELVAERSLESP